tara:strand:- start:4584 stop:4958 length:375 start_codon:yes stop_codon:yes gene_type:complete
MAVVQSNIPSAVGTAVHVVTQPFKDGVADAELASSGAGTLYAVEVDNTLNTATTYFKMYDTAGAVTVGTTTPTMILMCPGSKKIQYTFDVGITISAGITVVAVTQGGEGGTTTPSGTVTMRILD